MFIMLVKGQGVCSEAPTREKGREEREGRSSLLILVLNKNWF